MMSRNLDVFHRPPPVWQSTANPSLQSDATAVLREALAEAAEDFADISSLWETFQSFVLRYQYGEFMDRFVLDTRNRIELSIRETDYESVRDDAVSTLREEIREDMSASIRREMQPSIELEIRTELRLTLLDTVRAELKEELFRVMTPAIEQQIKNNLIGDPVFMAQVKSDLQRKILGL